MAQKDLFKRDLLKTYFKERKDKKKGIVPKPINFSTPKPAIQEREEKIIENAIQIVSDIHLEFPNVINKLPTIKVKAPILALLGDIGYPNSNEYQQFIEQCANKWKYVIIIAGNHEYYTECLEAVNKKIIEIANQYNNVYFLQCESLELPQIIQDTVILGCTLWIKFDEKYHMKAMEQINDYTYISTDDDKTKALRVENTNKMYDSHIEFIATQCEKAKLNNKKVIILTHHAPTDYKCIDPNYFNEISYLMNFTNIEHLFQPPVVAWFFGHTHFNMDILVKCDLKQMTYSQMETHDENGNEIEMKEEKNDAEDNNIWYVRIATNQQGYLHRGIADRYVANKIIKFPVKMETNINNNIEIIDYSTIVTLPYIKRLNQISDADEK